MSLLDNIRRFWRGTETRNFSESMMDRWMDYLISGTSGASNWNGEYVSPRDAQNIATVYRCISLISEVASTLPLHLYRRGSDDSRVIARSNFLYPLIHDMANPYMPAHQFREAMLRDALGWGNGWAVKEYDGAARTRALWRLDPSRCTPSWDDEARTFFVRYRLKDGNTKDYLASDLFHVAGPTHDGLLGYSVISYYAKNAMGASVAARRYGARFFKNAARPSGVLVHPAKLNPESRKNIVEGWKALTHGENSSGTAVLEEGVTYTPISINPEDAQFLETLDYNDHDVCKWFGVPPVLAGVVSKTTSWGTGIEQLNIGFLQYTLTKWLKRYEAAIARDLIAGTPGLYAEHDVAGLLRGDLKTQAEYLRSMTDGGLMTHNEVRAKLNLNPVPAGDMFARPLNTKFITPEGDIVEALEPPEPQTNTNEDPSDEQSAN